MTFIRKVKTKNGTYLAEVESYREKGKVRQRFLRYIGKEVEGKTVRRVSTDDIKLKSVKQSLDVLAVHKMAKDLGLDEFQNKRVIALVYAQLLGQTSVKKTDEWLKFTEIPDILNLDKVSSRNLYDAIEDLQDVDFDKVESKLSEAFRQYENSSKAAVVDVTDTYFEGKTLNIKRRRGKDGKVRRLVQIGLAVSPENGFPIMHKEYNGNLSNIQIFKDMSVSLKERGVKSIIIDRGMLSEENLDMLLKLNTDVIGGLKKTKTLVKKFITPIKRDEIFLLKNMVQLKNTKIYIKSFKYREGKIIVVYNPISEIYRKEKNFEQGIGKNSLHAGYSLIYHKTDFQEKDIVKKYYDKEIVERAFKQLKGVLNLRPIRMWLQNNIKSHIKICYLSYAILALMNYRLKKLGISGPDALDSLKHGYKVTLEEKNNHTWNLIVPLEPNQKKILKKLGVVYKN